MRFLVTLLAASLALVALDVDGKVHRKILHTKRRPLFGGLPPPGHGGGGGGGGGSGGSGSQVYNLNQANRGTTFFDNWTFWSTADPTHGSVAYQSKGDAQAQGLIGVNGVGQAFAKASSKDIPKGQNRPSVRFESDNKYDEAVIVFDVASMPIGCETWPALWTNWGNNWPNGGEADVLEEIGYTAGGTNANQYSVHMGDDSPNQASPGSYSGKAASKNTNCNTNYAKGMNGCSIRDSNAGGPSWGAAFNSAGGGVFAVQFGNNNGVKMWFFSRSKVPAQLSGGTKYAAPSLDVSEFGEPSANFQSPVINQKFKQQTIVVDITIGGDWAGSQPLDGKCAGQDRATALSQGSNYAEAAFVFNAINIYTQ